MSYEDQVNDNLETIFLVIGAAVLIFGLAALIYAAWNSFGNWWLGVLTRYDKRNEKRWFKKNCHYKLYKNGDALITFRPGMPVTASVAYRANRIYNEHFKPLDDVDTTNKLYEGMKHDLCNGG